MFNSEEISKKSKEIVNDFWSIDSLANKNNDLENFYIKNEEDWINNAKQLRNDFPVETNLFIANIYRSFFSYQLIVDRLQLFRKKQRFSVSDKIRILKNAFENSYHHFSLITICSNYSKDFVESLFKKWWIPDVARERIDNLETNPWRNTHGDIISGKKWTLINCPLFRFSPTQIDIIQLIKNADSHEKLVVTKSEIIILDSKKPVTIKIKDFNALFKYLHYVINLSFQFNIKLAIKYNFWITPTIILTNPERFEYKKKKLPDFPNTISKTKKESKKNNRKPTIEDLEYLIAIAFSLFQFVFGSMWKKILDDEREINIFLNHYNLKFNKKKFNEFHKKTLKDLLEILINENDIIKEFVLEENVEKPAFSLENIEISEFNLDALTQDFENTINKVYQTKSKTKKKAFKKVFIMSGLISLLPPLGRISESLKEIVIENKKNCG